VNSRKAIPVMGRSAATSGVPNQELRSTAWITKPPSQPRMSGTLPVNRVFRKVPESTMTSGKNQSPMPVRFSVNI
jgi:hypothetical protein